MTTTSSTDHHDDWDDLRRWPDVEAPNLQAWDATDRLLLDEAGPLPEEVVVIGDRHGRSAGGWLSREALALTRAAGFSAGLNDPFAGGHVLERHGNPTRGIHALQIEIDRRLYLDEGLIAPGPGFDRLARLIETLAARLGEAVAALPTATAAE